MSERLIAIGDIHGCSDALKTLLETIDPQPDDTIVVLGDVVDRGQGTRQAIDLLIEASQRTQIVAILGNHEEMMLRVLEGDAPQRWLQFGGIDTLDSYGFAGDFSVIPTSHHDFFAGMRDYYETDGYFFTHAAYKHDLPLDYQPIDLLRWHSLRDGLPPAHENGKIGFVGHTAHKEGEIMDFGYLVCLDTYCYGGGWLTAMDVRTRQTWQANRSGQLRSV
ncbi:Serine/threonine-protein phosphatase 1 [Rosistilla carotiformis]|uniref:Serine/threonine-protein phosphatase 1 n=1 Tax=Rosistilla carotiformis TaxID=2528017 RepID=A0A518JQY4_9BACT|nr:metallophosphoesterase family protein [Rosistilla carotiformis]QDV67955.1 Serine/threonine-protein phosphatase 1 [Rosistilla carotiformis]